MFFNTQPENNIDRAREAMKFFHNRSLAFPGYSLTLDALIEQVSKKHPTIFLDGLGMAIASIDMSSSKVKEAMEDLANQGQGRVPSNQFVFFKALSDEAQNIDWVAATGFVIKESAKEIVSGAQAVGDSVLTTLKGLNFIFPLLAIGGVLFIAVSKIRKAA